MAKCAKCASPTLFCSSPPGVNRTLRIHFRYSRSLVLHFSIIQVGGIGRQASSIEVAFGTPGAPPDDVLLGPRTLLRLPCLLFSPYGPGAPPSRGTRLLLRLPCLLFPLYGPRSPPRWGLPWTPTSVATPLLTFLARWPRCSISLFEKNDTSAFELELMSAMSNPKGGNRAPSIRIRAQQVVLKKRWTLGTGPGAGPWALGPGHRALGPGLRALGPVPRVPGPGPVALGPGPRAPGPGAQAIDTLGKL